MRLYSLLWLERLWVYCIYWRMSKWERCKKQFPHWTTLTEPEQDHLSIFFEDHFAATDQGQRFLFVLFTDAVLWSAGPTHPWHYLDNNNQVSEELLTAKFLDKEYIDNLHPLRGTREYQGKEVKYSKYQNCWTYLNNGTVHIHRTSASESPESPTDDNTAWVEQLLEWAKTTITLAIQKLQTVSRPASPAIQASLLPTPPVSKGKAPAPPQARTPVARALTPKASTVANLLLYWSRREATVAWSWRWL